MGDRPHYQGVQIKPYHGANWFTERGVHLKQKEIEKKGIPNLKWCKFLTLTVDGRGFVGAREAYELGSERMRRFLGKVRGVIGHFPWAWKLEFHEDGFPHWHVIIDYRKKIPPDFLDVFTEFWGLGRVNVSGIKQKRFHYLFKYVSKVAAGDCDEESGLDLPTWVLDYRKRRKDGRMTAGIRFWQTGGGFYTDPDQDEKKEMKEKQTSRVPYTIRERWAIHLRKAVLFVKDIDGNYRRSRQILFKQPYHEVAQQIINAFVDGKAAHAPECFGYMCGFSLIRKNIESWIQNQIKPLVAYYSRREMVYFSLD